MTKLLAYSGADLEVDFVCTDETGAAVDLTGYTPSAKVRASLSDAAPILDLAPTIPTPANGTIRVDVPAVETADVLQGSYKWDLTLETPDGNILHVCGGTIQFRQLASREDETPT